MSEPRTHYQLSFTPKQGMALFVGLLAALGLAYFFGLMTGLAGSSEEEVSEPVTDAASLTPPAARAPEGAGTAGDLEFPVPVTAPPGRGARPPTAATATAPSTIHVFEDRAAGAPPARRATSVTAVAARPAAPRGAGFRVQVVSVSSSDDAQAQAAQLTRQGFPAVVEPGTGPRGTVYRVRIGPFSTREEAARAVDRLAAAGRRGAWIVPPGQ